MSGGADYPGRFYIDVNDIPGRGGEYLFPTVNTRDELARHHRVGSRARPDRPSRSSGPRR